LKEFENEIKIFFSLLLMVFVAYVSRTFQIRALLKILLHGEVSFYPIPKFDKIQKTLVQKEFIPGCLVKSLGIKYDSRPTNQ